MEMWVCAEKIALGYPQKGLQARLTLGWHLGTWFGDCFYHSLTAKSVSMCLNCVVCFMLNISFWKSGILEHARLKCLCDQPPVKTLGTESVMSFPHRQHFSHVPFGAGGMCVLSDSTGIGLLEACLVSSRLHPMCLFPLSPSLIVNLSCEHNYICGIPWV